MLGNIVDLLKAEDFYKDLTLKLNKGEVYLHSPNPAILPLIASAFYSEGKYENIVVIAREPQIADVVNKDIKLFVGEKSEVYHFPDLDVLPCEKLKPKHTNLVERIVALDALASSSKPKIVTTSLRAILRYTIPKKVLLRFKLTLRVGDSYPPTDVVKRLVSLGYKRVNIVTMPAEFSLRGDTLDIFPINLDNPVRISFWDDEVENIKYFDVVNQYSEPGSDTEEVEVLPAYEIIFDDTILTEASSRIKDEFGQESPILEIIARMLKKEYFPGIETYLPYFYDPPATLLDFLSENTLIILQDFSQLNPKRQKLIDQISKICKPNQPSANLTIASTQYLDNLVRNFRNKVYVYSLMQEGIEQEVIVPDLVPGSTFKGTLENFKLYLKQRLKDFTIVIGASYKAQAKRLLNIFEEFNPKYAYGNFKIKSPGLLYITVGEPSHSFKLPKMRLEVIAEHNVFGRTPAIKRRQKQAKSAPLESLDILKEGDLVVHINYGIAIYKGIESFTYNGNVYELIILEFGDGEILKIPLSQANLIQRYIGPDKDFIKPTKRDGSSWQRTKERVKQSVQRFAQQLVKLYAKRSVSRGFAFEPDNYLQHEFESTFSYTETPDQLKAIEEVKKDMEVSTPMDRLVCGDVGFGKTEVAMRAAFKAVMSGKQVALVAPTTVLVEQHYETFSERMSRFGIKVTMLSRLVPQSKRTKILKDLKEGKIDIIIGTHALLSKNVIFKNLGLLIIDEEHKFGVEHKEKIKQRYPYVDVLTMSATPIPRTLSMALGGIFGISVIETPPEGRLPVKTYVMEFSPEIVVKAITNEVSRGGQVFYIYNEVATIHTMARRLREILPSNIRLAVAHGQMPAKQLEEVVKAFRNHEFDVLLCTTIIESGIDMPNVNTIIVHNADRMGLAQLYQLKGRVGRSTRQAYAYFLYPAGKPLSEEAYKRLATLAEYSELGSGYKVALKDLEIRGAGNLLGKEQSGNIAMVGYELYLKILSEAIKRYKLNKTPSEDDNSISVFEPEIVVSGQAYIPQYYVPDSAERFWLYRKISGASSEEDLEKSRRLIEDRYGTYPQEVDNLLRLMELKVLAKEVGISSIKENGEYTEVEFCKDGYSKVNPNAIPGILKSNLPVKLDPHSPNKIYIKTSNLPFVKKIDTIKQIIRLITR